MPQASEHEIEVFNVALELPAAERSAYLDGACAGDAALRQRIEELLKASAEACPCLEGPPAVSSGPGGTVRLPLSHAEKPGDRIGRYKLLQQIGEGGCGVVYMAEQQEPVHRRVALKVIKLGMDTKNVIARFEAERQALALMDHPNIAKVLDAGATDTGRPFFVMELVRGIKITDYCDQANLPTNERLDLFVQVCHAIQHAHQKGIIHRDIKPSNILVTMDDRVALPKVIDFGIAKATQGRLTDLTLFTAFEQFIGTPAYMSPEQAEMRVQDIDTRSDIYSLGVLLYELLTGQTPFDAKKLLEAGLDEIRRTIREREPPRPSTCLSTMLGADLTEIARLRKADPPKLIHLVRGDLDWIVMKCMEKDRARRYETANGVAMDVRRYLADEPVVACPPSAIYKLRKFVLRNKITVLAGTLIVVVLVLGVIGTTIGLVLAERQHRVVEAARRQAQGNFDQARAAVGDMLTVQDEELFDVPGMQPLRVKMMQTAITRYKAFLSQPSADPAPQAELARLYVQYGFAAVHNGADYNQVAKPAYDSALAIQEQLIREYPENRALRSDLGWTCMIYSDFGNADRNKLQRAIDLLDPLVREDPGDPLARGDLATALSSMVWHSTGSHVLALSNRALEIREQLVEEFPRSAEFRSGLASSLKQQAHLLQTNFPTRLAIISRATDLLTSVETDMARHDPAIWLPARPRDSEEVLLLRPNPMWTKRDVAAMNAEAAYLCAQFGQWPEATTRLNHALGIYRQLVEQNPSMVQFVNEFDMAQARRAAMTNTAPDVPAVQVPRVIKPSL